MENVTVQLSYPIKAHGETLLALTLRRPKVGDLRAVDGLGDMGKLAKLIERCAGIPATSVDQIDAVDVAALGEVIGGFLGGSLANGAT